MNSPIPSECSICLSPLNVPPEQTGVSSAFGRWCGKFIKSFRIRENTIVTLSPCMHQFHYPCIRLWAKKTFRCPVDRGLLMKVSVSLKASIDEKKELLSSIELNRPDEVKYLLATGLDPNFTSGRTCKNPLLLALKLQYWNIVAELISHGATSNHPEAQERLGWAYQHGAGVKRNYKMAVDLFFRSAAQGHVLALSDLGWMYQHGLGVRQDYVEALNLYRRGAMKGSAVAQNNLGCMYLNGFGVIQDYRQAISWARTELVRLQTQLASGEAADGLEDEWDEAGEWVAALLADIAGAETASPSGGPAFVAAAEDAAADAVTFVVQGAMSDGSLRIEISRPIYGNFEDADITALCWGAVACD